MKRRTARASWSVTASPFCIFFMACDIETASPTVVPTSMSQPTNGMFPRFQSAKPERKPADRDSPERRLSISSMILRPSESFSSSARENCLPNTYAARTSFSVFPRVFPIFPSGS